MRIDWLAIGVGCIFVVVLVAFAASLLKEATDPCVRYVETGGMTCWNTDAFTSCEPDRRCVQRRSQVPGRRSE